MIGCGQHSSQTCSRSTRVSSGSRRVTEERDEITTFHGRPLKVQNHTLPHHCMSPVLCLTGIPSRQEATHPRKALRAHLAQLGITAAQGREGLRGWSQTMVPSVQSVKSVCVDGVGTLLKSVNWCRESVYTTFCGVIKEGVKGRNAL